jgi:hypothetical protein
MCDDVNALVADMKRRGIATSPLHEERWGILTQITLPSGGKLGIYQPTHASPLTAARKKSASGATRKKAPASPAKRAAAPKKKAKRRASRATKKR